MTPNLPPVLPGNLRPFPPLPEGYSHWEYRGLAWDNGRRECVFAHLNQNHPHTEWIVDSSGEGSPIGEGCCPNLHYIEAIPIARANGIGGEELPNGLPPLPPVPEGYTRWEYLPPSKQGGITYRPSRYCIENVDQTWLPNDQHLSPIKEGLHYIEAVKELPPAPCESESPKPEEGEETASLTWVTDPGNPRRLLASSSKLPGMTLFLIEICEDREDRGHMIGAFIPDDVESSDAFSRAKIPWLKAQAAFMMQEFLTVHSVRPTPPKPEVEPRLSLESRELIASCDALAIDLRNSAKGFGIGNLDTRASLAERNVDYVTEQSKKLAKIESDLAAAREIFPKICEALGNGSCCTPDASIEFLSQIPNEVRLEVEKKDREIQRLRAALEAVTSKSFYSKNTGYYHVDPSAISAAKAALEGRGGSDV